jgi:DNA helicase-2/ATP-dependent DNA helicase PcrA
LIPGDGRINLSKQNKTMDDNDQSKAIHTTAARTVVIAGPGSGKTRVLVGRIARLIRTGESPKNICAITFTNAAAAEMHSRITEEFRHLETPVEIGYCGTIHALLLRLIQERSERKIVVLDAERSREILDECIEQLKYKGTLRDVNAQLERGPVHFKNRVDSLSKPETVAALYFKTLANRSLMDFDSVLWWGAELLASGGMTFPYPLLLVDEYQDSGPLDEAVYRAAAPIKSFFVGDPQQSIYGFRGGTPKYLMAEAGMPGTNTVQLLNNYRCDDAICRAANVLMGTTSTTSRTGHQGQVRVMEFATDLEEQRWVIETAETYLKEFAQGVAVLVRTNHLVEQYLKALQLAGVPCAARNSADRPKDWRLCLDLIELFCDPNNDYVAWRALCEIEGKAGANRIQLRAAKEFKSINAFHFNLPADMQLASVAAGLGKVSDESRALVARTIADNPSIRSAADLAVVLMQEDLTPNQEIAGVTVSTMHGAKGHEWDVVILPAFNEGIIPSKRALAEPDGIAEERRLAFVAFTRARRDLVITFARSRTPPWKDRKESAIPSVFLEDQPAPNIIPTGSEQTVSK